MITIKPNPITFSTTVFLHGKSENIAIALETLYNHENVDSTFWGFKTPDGSRKKIIATLKEKPLDDVFFNVLFYNEKDALIFSQIAFQETINSSIAVGEHWTQTIGLAFNISKYF